MDKALIGISRKGEFKELITAPTWQAENMQGNIGL